MTETAAAQAYNENTPVGGDAVTQVVYVDVLVGVNLIVNYFLILATARFLSLPFHRRRLFAAASLGALYSLSILLPEWNTALSLLIKLLMAASIVLAAFGWKGLKPFFRATAAFYIINFAFAGFMVAVWYFLAPQGLLIRNSMVYFDISPLMLIAMAVGCYLVITLIYRITGRQMPKELFCRVEVYCGEKMCCLVGKVDTGNTLREPFSGDPVMVAYEPKIASVIPPRDSLNFRLVPFDAVSGGGVLEAFHPDRITIRCGKQICETDRLYIAVTKRKFGEFDALLSPDLLQRKSG